MSLRGIVLLIVGVVLAIALLNSVYRVQETERALLLRFGAIQQADIKPGLGFKLPIADEVKKFDARVLTLDSPPETYYTLEKKPLIVDSFVKWRIDDVLAYYQATSGEERQAYLLLSERTNEGLRNEISSRDMHDVISGERDQLMQNLTQALDRAMRETVGIEVIDVRVKRIDLPADVSNEVYRRMTSEREVEAKRYRAQGNEMAVGIRADADRQTVVIEAEAYREAERIRGDGDAQSASIYAAAFTQDPEFYEFYRSINAYANVFGEKSDLLVLDPSSEFFKYLKSGD